MRIVNKTDDRLLLSCFGEQGQRGGEHDEAVVEGTAPDVAAVVGLAERTAKRPGLGRREALDPTHDRPQQPVQRRKGQRRLRLDARGPQGQLGPGRLQIRQDGFEAFRVWGSLRLMSVIVPAFLFLGIFVAGLWRARNRLPAQAQIAGVLYTLPPGLLLLALGYWKHFRLLGRHFIPLFPPVLGLMALGVIGLVSFRRRLGIVAGVILVGIWL
ncbi:MAG: hypothetical protein ABJB93_08415, partial [Gaiellales bacterium]